MSKRRHESTRRENKVRAALISWEALNELISDMDEEDVLHAMRVESEAARRKSFIRRLSQRLNGIRTAEVMKEVAAATEEVTTDGSARRGRRRN